METNARLQAEGIALGGNVTYLDSEEARHAEAAARQTRDRPWELWKRKALGVSPTFRERLVDNPVGDADK